MPDKKKTLGFLGVGLFGLGAYLLRKRVIARLLGMGRPRNRVAVKRNIPIVMADGSILRADLFAPLVKGLSPTILIRTPYGRGGTVGPTGLLHDFFAQRFAERGYNVLVQDVRGCFDSDGEFMPFAHEAQDGRATLEWIEEQPWFNGVLGMWGPSYLGYVQWAVAGGGPLYLKAIVPVISGANLPLTGYRDGALAIDTLLRWVIQLDALDRKAYLKNWFGLRRMSPRGMDSAIDRATMQLPLSDIDKQVVGVEVPFVRDWMNHLDDTAYWNQFDHSRELSQVTASAHLVSGWYDILLRELLEDYAALKSNGRTPYLTVGPWHHLDSECLTESLRQGLTWFDVHLKGERGELRSSPVRICVMGGGGWREMDTWPPPSRKVLYFLGNSRGDPDGEGGSLSLKPPGEESEPVSYVYDPETPTPAVGGPVMRVGAGPVDNRQLEARSDVVIYTTSPLEKDIEVVGPVRLRLYVRSSLEYSDFFGRLCDVHPDGRSINLCDGLLRLEPGKGSPQSDGSLLIDIDLWATANRFQAGHRIRLQVSSGAHPRWMRNLGTDTPLISATKSTPAQQTIYNDPKHPSVLILPVISSQE